MTEKQDITKRLSAFSVTTSFETEALILSAINEIFQLRREVEKLKDENKGPDGFATWKDAAISERVRRVQAEKSLEVLNQDLYNLTEKVIPNIREERDAAIDVLKEYDRVLENEWGQHENPYALAYGWTSMARKKVLKEDEVTRERRF